MDQQRTGVVLIHGIGDQQHGTTIRDFLKVVTKLGYSKPVQQMALRDPGNHETTDSYFIAEENTGDKQTVYAEMYWADLSRIRSGFMATVRNFSVLTINAPDIIYSALGPNTVGDKVKDYFILRFLRAFMALTIWTIYFPIIALNLVYAIMTLGVAGRFSWFPPANASTLTADKLLQLHTPIVLALTAMFAIIILVSLLRFNLNKYAKAMIGLMIISLAILLCFPVADIILDNVTLQLKSYMIAISSLIAYLWLFVYSSNLLFLFLLPFLLIAFWKRRRGILLGFGVNFIIIQVCSLLITTSWLAFLTLVFDAEIYGTLVPQISKMISFMSLIWMNVVIIGVALLASFVVYLVRGYFSKGQNGTKKYPRLIVPTPVLLLSVFLSAAWIIINLFCNCNIVIFQTCETNFCLPLPIATEYILNNAVILLAVGGFVIQFTHIGFEVATDIVNYFRTDLLGHRRISPLSAMASVAKSDFYDHTGFRTKLQNRLNTVMDDYCQHFGPFDRIVIVCHSLGSMIAIEHLQNLFAKGTPMVKYSLVTMASPYSSIYHHYFPHMFKPLDKNLLPELESWTNIYRENDFVGTALTDGNQGVNEILVQPPLGHLGYFFHESSVDPVVKYGILHAE